jgi:hypothetical protein
MPASLTITPASGSVVATKSATKVTVVGADQNAVPPTGYSGALGPNLQPLQYPSSPEMRYYLTFELGGAIRGKSYVFGVDETGGHLFNNYIFPSAGSWTVRLSNAADNSSVATTAVTVS